ncbi:hypothetical protein CPB86DRAFT_393064 [Serendipita vermifera]|nr:hypothetical protein CPB86DRAFT_393064 [Serendipita vermifera]
MEWIHAVTRPLLRLFEISIESFFFVPEGIPGGWLLAVPNRFKTIRQDSSNNSRLSDHIYEEEVYDLESLRYPVKIRLMEDLPERMIEQLRKSIAGKVINSPLYISWKLWKIDTGVETLRSKYSAARIVNATWRFLLPAFEMIHPNDYFVSDPDASSKDKRVSADIHIRLCSSDEIVILGEGLDPITAETYISDLVKLASGEIRSNFEGELPDKFVGHEAILAKVLNCNIAASVQLTYRICSYRTR